MYLASGVPPIPAMLAAGLTVSLGSDGPASSNNHSLFQAMKMAALIQKGTHRDPTIVTGREGRWKWRRSMARGAIGLEAEIGSIEVLAKKADLAVVGTNHPAMAPGAQTRFPPWVYSALGHEVTDVFIDGRPVMRAGRIITVDEGAVLAPLSCRRRQPRQAVRGGDRFKARPWRSATF